MVTRVTRTQIFIGQHTTDYERTFSDIVAKVSKDKGPVGRNWTFQFLRPVHTAYNLNK
jgi:hypothetical protein